MSAAPAWMQADWGNLVMVSWLVSPSLVQTRMPAGCTPDLWEGAAAVSLVGVEFSNVVVKGISWPWHDRFPEVNLRTYVQGPNGPGVVFLGEMVPKFFVARLARKTFGEPYEKRKVRMESGYGTASRRQPTSGRWGHGRSGSPCGPRRRPVRCR